MKKTNEKTCPICDTLLVSNGREFSLDELLAMWKPVVFTQMTIDEHKTQGEYTQLHICPSCGLGIFIPQIIGTSDFYVDLLKNESTYAYSEEKWDFDEALKDAEGCKWVMEIGCGPGNFLEKLKPYVENVYGTEYNRRALKVARDRGLNIFGMKDESAERLKGRFDIVFSFHVLEHVPDPVAFIQEMLSWVKPGGKIGISVPNMDGPVKYINPCVSNMPPHHATQWRLHTFKALAERLGLELERVAYEPLTAESHYYYSIYWVESVFPDNSFIMRRLRSIGRMAFSLFFKILSMFGKDSTPLLRGQSIYVLLSKRD
jgi:SAM-dependent methyltransferase